MQDHLGGAFALLRAVADRPDPTEPVTVGVLAQAVRVTTSSASRTAAAWQEVGMLAPAAGYGAYQLGRRAVALSGRAAAPEAPTVDFVLTWLAAVTGETASLVAPAPGGARVVAAVLSNWTVHVGARVGDGVDPAGAAAAALRPPPAGRAASRGMTRSAGPEHEEFAVAVHDATGRAVAALVVQVPALRAAQVTPVAERILGQARRRLETAAVRAPAVPRHPVPADDGSRLGVAAAVLEQVCRQRTEPLRDLASRLGLRPERVERVIAGAAAAGLVDPVDDGTAARPTWYLHGWHRAVTAAVLTGRVGPLVADAAREAGATAYLTVRRGSRSVTVAEAFGNGALSTQSWLARPAQMFGADGGALLVMDFDDRQIAAVLPSRAVVTARHTPRDLDAFLREVRRARDDGRLVLDGFAEEGLTSVAAPVRCAAGTVVAAACLVGPGSRLTASLAYTTAVADRFAAAVSEKLVAPDR
ncbi:IclR family transcriptional regulator domain-containing protein [Nakamurella deserti]|uniref:IclR family transcriptional regulator domain-containing protein n=1 Tax=Nakamurella deserti TaxID=2164074 RepID=UPI000DBE9673|nr:IclR family transcriptional regulator C-terminal domain-containing protein [Nakamurella deserti]